MPTVGAFPTSRQDIAGVLIAEIAQQFNTPTFVYDAAVIVERIEDLKSFDLVRYAQKASSNIAILDLARRHGVVVDAVSAGEIHRELQAGYHGGINAAGVHEIVYTADIFDKDALDLVVEHDIHVNCGSPDMIDQLGACQPGAQITLRLNPGFGHGHSQKTNTGGQQSKHGIWPEQIESCKERAAKHNITISGLHMHIGSGTDLEHLAQVCGAMEQAVLEVGNTITTISAGGGLPVPYNADQFYVDLDRYYTLWDQSRKKLEAELGHSIKLEIEPGRYLVAESGNLITEIRAVKKMGENIFYLVDAGFNNLARPIMYGSYHPISVVVSDDRSREDVDVVVGGPLCESGDIFTQEEGGFVSKRTLPQADVGEYLVLECAGAYGSVMGSNYNSKPLAAEVMIVNGRSHLIRERQSYADLMRGEHLLDD
ncbi:MAG: diaminopimelate decarboxylase [Planctomycetota bacterium]|nr:diaminopimelate decarboxylase [Planctomycetota bacterium]